MFSHSCTPRPNRAFGSLFKQIFNNCSVVITVEAAYKTARYIRSVMTMTAPALRLVLSLALTALPWVATATEKPADDQSLRQELHIDPSVQLYFRGSDGGSLDEKTFLDHLHHGEAYWFSGAYHGKLVLTLGSGPGLAAPPHNKISNLARGDAFPRFDTQTLNGDHVSNAMFKNRITLIDFFALYCGACIAEMPTLNAFKAAHPKIQTVAMTFDPAVNVRDLVQQHHFQWDVVGDALPVFRSAGLWFSPTFALIDQHGRLIVMGLPSSMRPKGQPLSENDLAQWIDHHVATANSKQ
jgi:thiol-disulfide isomerase/thioredoxin